MKTFLLFLLCAAQALAQKEYTVISTVPGTAPASDSVNVSCTFLNQWTAESHPNSYPTGNAHWSPMILASHNANYTMWASGALASPSVQIVAETGVKLTLLVELGNSTDVLAQEDGKAMFMSNAESQLLDAFRVDAAFPLISSISMIAPSPDWFSGFTNFSPLNATTNTWYDSFKIDTYPWDAGTDSGTTYNADDTPTDPPQNISQWTVDSLPAGGVFLSSDGATVLPVARWSCTVAAVGAAPTVAPTAGNTTVTEAPTADTTVPSVAPSGSDSESVMPSAGSPTGTAVPTAYVIPYSVLSTQPSTTKSSQAVGFSCSIANQWTEERHPEDYPTDTARWNPMVLASHSSAYQMWGNGQLASVGVKSLAMSGSPALLLAELAVAEDGVVLDENIGTVMNIATSQEQIIEAIRLDAKHPYITSISMISPSPDWFSGFSDFNALNSTTNTWYQSFVLETYPWDAGTDLGTTYKADDVPTDPPEKIFQLTVETAPTSGVFVSGNESSATVRPVATWNCTQVAAPPSPQTSGSFLASLFVASLMSLTITLFVAL